MNLKNKLKNKSKENEKYRFGDTLTQNNQLNMYIYSVKI
jgi:hypothetical protein